MPPMTRVYDEIYCFSPKSQAFDLLFIEIEFSTRGRRIGIPAGGCEPTFCRQGWAWQLELLESKWGIAATRMEGVLGVEPQEKFLKTSPITLALNVSNALVLPQNCIKV